MRRTFMSIAISTLLMVGMIGTAIASPLDG